MKICITGASGLLGKSLFDILSKNEEVVGTYLDRKLENLYFLDVSDKNSVESFFEKTHPEIIIHTAAIVDVDFCEENKEKVRKVNIEGTQNLVDICKRHGSKIIFISSDYIFDGKNNTYNEVNKDSPINPVNYYGLTKLEGERIVKENLENYIILRPAILYGNDQHCKPIFISKVLEKLNNNEKLFIDDKIVKYPTLVDDIGFAIKKLIEIDARGTFHISGEEPVTKYQWAKKIAKLYDLPTKNIISSDANSIAKRPLNVNLGNSKIRKLFTDFSTKNVKEGIEIIKNQKGCLFKMIYSARPDMLVLNQSASSFRVDVGKQLVKEHPTKADIVIPIPESGIYGATGYSAESKIPFYFGLIRDYYTNKTLFSPTLKMRNAALNKKLIVVSDIVRDKRIVLVDEAILAGTTLTVAIKKLKNAGAKEIHIRIPSPPILHNCESNILEPDAKLIAKRFGTKKEDIEGGLRQHFGIDSLHFISFKGFANCLDSNQGVCAECFKNAKSTNN